MQRPGAGQTGLTVTSLPATASPASKPATSSPGSSAPSASTAAVIQNVSGQNIIKQVGGSVLRPEQRTVQSLATRDRDPLVHRYFRLQFPPRVAPALQLPERSLCSFHLVQQHLVPGLLVWRRLMDLKSWGLTLHDLPVFQFTARKSIHLCFCGCEYARLTIELQRIGQMQLVPAQCQAFYTH